MVQGEVNNVTETLLIKCAAVGYRRICIGVKDRRVPQSQSFVFGTKGSVFAWPEKPKINECPAIWQILDEVGASGHCGNHHQHTYIEDMLNAGYYWLNKQGKWLKGK